MKRVPHEDKRIVHINFATQHDLCSTFVRLQEFYESPFGDIRGKYFTLDQFMDRYARENGSFSYFTDWAGFNVPGNVVMDFWHVFYSRMRDKEWSLLYDVNEFITRRNEEFYLIGTYGDDEDTVHSVEHELAHAYYYLDEGYRDRCGDLFEKLSENIAQNLRNWLIRAGYMASVVADETQAYLSTGPEEMLKERFNISQEEYDEFVIPYRENFTALKKGA